MHVASVMIFEGELPSYDELLEAHREPSAPRPPLPPAAGFGAARPGPAGLGRRPALQPRATTCATPRCRARAPRSSCATWPAACSPSSSTATSRCGRSGSSTGLEGDRFALLAKTHHALVDGVSGVDIATVLFDAAPDAPPPAPPERPWVPRPLPSDAPAAGRGAGRARHRCRPRSCAARARLFRGPRRVVRRVVRRAAAVGAMASGGINPRPAYPANVADLAPPPLRLGRGRARAASRRSRTSSAARSTTSCSAPSRSRSAAGCAPRLPDRRPELKAMVPVCVRADTERGALGNKVAAMWAPLPVWSEDPVETFALVHAEMGELKESGQAVGATVLTELSDFAPPTIMSQAARLQSRQRFFNLVVTNVPGPQYPALPARAPAAGDLPDGPAGQEPGARHRDHELRRQAVLRPRRRLRRDGRPRLPGRRPARGDRGAGRGRGPAVRGGQRRRAARGLAPSRDARRSRRRGPDAPPMAFSMPRSRPGTRSPRRDAGRARRST